MAGTPKGGTIPRLSLQRVEGKPYIVSEYNHAAPNTFTSEAFPLICAYAALQDWDGIFAFAYSHRPNDWDKGMIPSFFDIDQHPTKMATLPASAALWLRGDVQRAKSAAIAPIALAGDQGAGSQGRSWASAPSSSGSTRRRRSSVESACARRRRGNSTRGPLRVPGL